MYEIRVYIPISICQRGKKNKVNEREFNGRERRAEDTNDRPFITIIKLNSQTMDNLNNISK